MVASAHTQSLTDFSAKADEVFDRLDKTGEAEVITVNGEARAVLLSPAVYDEMARELQLSREADMMRRAMREHDEGKARPAQELFDELHAELLAMKEAEENGSAE
jgi:PHD/YefM family antitoxin component YafN of YafNO toxin-antitoxin module